jgi:multiple sugar transport system ATP-binding protein
MSLADRIAIMHGGEIVQYDTPMRIYQDPATVFCGGFIGNPPMNFLPAHREEAGAYRIDGSTIPGPAAGPREALMGIRPEDLRIVEGGGAHRLSGEVGVLEPLGPHKLLIVRVGNQTIRVAAEPDGAVRHGQVIHLEPTPERVRWFDAASEKAIPA